MKFETGKNNIVWIGDNFKSWFGDMEVKEEKAKLYTTELKGDMLDSEILNELKPTECKLGDILTAMKENKLLTNGYANIFYIKDKNGVLCAVDVHWCGDGWSVYADSVSYPNGWRGGRRVFSLSSFDSLTLSPSEALEKAIETVKKAGLEVYKKYENKTNIR